MCSRGVSPITINTYARAINAFLRWLHEEERSPKLVRIPRLKEPETVVQTFCPEQVQHLMQYRPFKDAEAFQSLFEASGIGVEGFLVEVSP